MQHKFAIVEELSLGNDDDADKWVEVVCTSWFDGKYCLFPPKSKEKLITSYVKTCYPPDSSWVKYLASLIKTYGNFFIYILEIGVRIITHRSKRPTSRERKNLKLN